MTDYATTGDGLIAGLQFMAEMAQTGEKASTLTQSFEPVPQMLRNIKYTGDLDPLSTEKVAKVIADGEVKLAKTGRLVIRKSGTEPLIRVMGEDEDQARLNGVLDEIVGAIQSAT